MSYQITEEQKKILLQYSAQTLPDNPSRDGFSAEAIRKRMYKPTEKLVDLVNAVFDTVYTDVQSILSDIQNGDFFARSIASWSASYNYGANEITFYPSIGTYGAFVQSVVAGNTNNVPYVNGAINSAYWKEVVNFNTIAEDYFQQIQSAVTQAESAASEAESSAQAAAGSATQSAGSAAEAAQSAQAAQTSAKAAQVWEERAANFSENAENSMNTASEYVSEAHNAADAAYTAMQSAQSSATEAQGYADYTKQLVDGLGGVYIPQGSLAFASLPAQPAAQYQGYVWNITDAFTTDSRFLEGAGESVPAGANVACVLVDGAYKYDVLSGIVDLSNYAQINGTYSGMTVGNATNADTADSANTAQDAAKLGGVAASQYAQQSDLPVANPTATGTEELTSLQVGGTVYNIPQNSEINVVENPILSLFTKDTATLNFSALGQEVYVEYYYLKENQNPVNIPITATLSFSDLEMDIPVTNVFELYAVLSIFGYMVAGGGELPSTKVTGISGIQNTLVQNPTIVTSAFNVVSGSPDLETPAFVANSFIMKKFPASTFIDFQLDFGEYLVEIHLNSIEDTYLTISTIRMVAGSRTLPLPSLSTAGQVPVVNAAGNGYELVEQSGGITQSTVIERPESLPTATADSPDFVEVGGVLYRKKAVEGGNLLGTWVFNDTLSITDNDLATFFIGFSSAGETFNEIVLNKNKDAFQMKYLSTGSTHLAWSVDYPDNNGWWNVSYKTIQITDISALTNEAEFTSWLTANATKQGGGVSVTYEYVAQQDAGASGGGTKLYCHKVQFDGDGILYHVINNSNVPIETLQDLKNNQLYIVGRLNVDTSYYPVVGCFNGVLVYIAFTGGWTGVTGANFATKDVSSVTSISDIVVPL